MFLALALGIYRPDITWSSAPGIGPVGFSKNGLWLRSDSFHHDEPPATRVVQLMNKAPALRSPRESPGAFRVGAFFWMPADHSRRAKCAK